MSEYTSIKKDVLQKLETNLPEIQDRFGIETLGIFGSVSRGEDTQESDVDVLYKFHISPIRLRNYMALQEYLSNLFGRNVDLVSLEWIEPMIEPYVRKDMILFSGAKASA